MSSHENNYQARVLLGVWGESFIHHFLKFSLPSMLAPGNLPALAAEFPVTFVFMTRLSDVHVFEESPAFQKLKSICKVEFISVKDLIVFGNYSTTLTYAYDRAIRATGQDMLNTYFIFMTSDYIMADGSMRGLMRYIKKGYSGICAGNYQVIQEDMEPYLLDHIDKQEHVMAIQPRELVKQSMKYLHPVAIASMVDQPVIHNYRANRFFVRHNPQVLAGRFYLLHMLCIKPETMDYRVGASCDYSFIPEMCPSGNVGIIDDSDDYLVVEVQPREHELNYVDWGKYEANKLVTSLAEWTTARHRCNSLQTIYYHSGELSDVERRQIDKNLSDFVNPINKKMARYELQPHYGHPYWQGATKSFEGEKTLLDKAGDCDYFDLLGLSASTLPRRLYSRLFGVPPNVYFWHYRYGEYQPLMKEVKSYLTAQGSKNALVLYGTYMPEFMRYRTWLENDNLAQHHYFLPSWIHKNSDVSETQAKKYDACVIMLKVENMDRMHDVINRIRYSLEDKSEILVLVANDRKHVPNFIFDILGEFTARISTIVDSSLKISKTKEIYCNTSLLGALTLYRIARRFNYSKKIRFACYAIIGIPGILFTIISNIFGKFIKTRRHCTNILVTLTPDEEQVK